MEQWKAWEKEAKVRESLLYASLKKMDKNELLEIYVRASEHFPVFSTFALFQYAASPEVFVYADELIQETIGQGLCTLNPTERQVSLAAEGGEIVLDRANYFSSQEDLLTALQLYLSILSNYLPVLRNCEAADEPVVFLIDRCINLIHNTVLQIAKNHSKAEKRVAFEKISEEATKSIYAGWFDWRADLLQSCVCLCEDLQIRKSLENVIEEIIVSMPGSILYKKYVGCQLQLVRHSVMQSFDSQEEVDIFVMNNIHYDTFRQFALDKALQDKQYEKVLELAIGENWIAYAFRAYQELEDRKNQVALGEELLLQGEIKYYPDLKTLFSDEEWVKELEILLEYMECQEVLPETYIQLLKEERIYDRLLSYLERNPEVLPEVAEILIEEKPREVKNIFLVEIEKIVNTLNFLDEEAMAEIIETIKFFFSLFGEREGKVFLTQVEKMHQGQEVIRCWEVWSTSPSGE